jgi:hypothetical protein
MARVVSLILIVLSAALPIFASRAYAYDAQSHEPIAMCASRLCAAGIWIGVVRPDGRSGFRVSRHLGVLAHRATDPLMAASDSWKSHRIPCLLITEVRDGAPVRPCVASGRRADTASFADNREETLLSLADFMCKLSCTDHRKTVRKI